MNNRAALELSINAIVVLILAITILGLGIGFIRGQFSGLSDQFTQVRSEIKDQLIEKIKESGDLLVFNRAELEVTTGKKDTFYIGVKAGTNQNEGKSSLCYKMGIRCLRPLSSSNTCGINAQTGQVVTVGGTTYPGPESTLPENEWFKMFDQVDIANNQVGVFPVTVQISNAKPDTYAMEFVVYEGDNDVSTGCGNVKEIPYQTKQFFVILK